MQRGYYSILFSFALVLSTSTADSHDGREEEHLSSLFSVLLASIPPPYQHIHFFPEDFHSFSVCGLSEMLKLRFASYYWSWSGRILQSATLVQLRSEQVTQDWPVKCFPLELWNLSRGWKSNLKTMWFNGRLVLKKKSLL